MNTSRPRVKPSPNVVLRSQSTGDISGVKLFNRNSAPSPLSSAMQDASQCLGGVCWLDPAVSNRRAGYPVVVNQVENGVCRASNGVDQAFSALPAEPSKKLVRIILQTRNNLTAVSARSAPTWFPCIDDSDAYTSLSEV
jgi:hypothetical protein